MKVVYFPYESVSRLPEVGKYITYGIRGMRKKPGGWVCEVDIGDISTDGHLVRCLAETCTRFELDPIHLHDIVEDMLEE